MMNWRVSFTALQLTQEEIEAWVKWVAGNIPINEVKITNTEDDHASDAKDNNSPAQRVSVKRVGR